MKLYEKNEILKEVYVTERTEVVKKLGKYYMNIKVLERADPNVVVAKRTLAVNQDGSPKSTQDVTAKEHLEITKQEAQGLENRLVAIEILLKEL